VVGSTLESGDPLWALTERRRSKLSDGALVEATREPFAVSDAAVAVELFAEYLAEKAPLRLAALEELGGRDLGCWCPIGSPCHGDYLLDLVNNTSTPRWRVSGRLRT
jgi:Domain of unknown function (DUF4326)